MNNILISVTAEQLDKLHLGYAITIHKSQGSQWLNCFAMLPKETESMMDQTLLYTAATRPSKRLILMGHERIIEQDILTGSVAPKKIHSLEYLINIATQPPSIRPSGSVSVSLM